MLRTFPKEMLKSTSLDNPSGDCRNGEVADDTDNHEYDIHTIACLDGEIRVSLHRHDVVLQHQHLYLGEYGTEQVGHRKPQIGLYISAYPLCQCALEPVPHADGKGYRSQYGEYNQEEGTQGVYH